MCTKTNLGWWREDHLFAPTPPESAGHLMPNRSQNCSNQWRNSPKCLLHLPWGSSKGRQGGHENSWPPRPHRGGHAQRWATECTCPAHQHLQRKPVSQRGLEKITATMTRKLQMCLQLQCCSMLKVRNTSGGKLQFRLGTDLLERPQSIQSLIQPWLCCLYRWESRNLSGSLSSEAGTRCHRISQERWARTLRC